MRLNQSRRQKIGYTYSPQIVNDVILQPKMKNMSYIQDQSFEQNMKGQGISDVIRGVKTAKDNAVKFIDKAVDISKTIDPIKTTETINNPNNQNNPNNPNYFAKQNNLSDLVKKGVKIYKDIQARKTNPTGTGLSLAGSGLNPAGSGLNPAGSGLKDLNYIDISKSKSKEPKLPGDVLKKKILQKMVRERRMKALGDRVNTSPIENVSDISGGSLVIPTINNKMGSQSMSKTLPSTKGYKLNPKPLVGAGLNPNNLGDLVNHLQSKLIPILKSKNLVPDNLTNSENIKKLISIRVKKIFNDGIKDPEKIIKKIVESLKPIMKKGQSGNGISGKGVKLITNAVMKSFKKQKGGFIIAGLIALGSLIAGAASAAAATTVVGSVTVGSLMGAALTGAAGAAGAAVVKKIAGGSAELKDKIVDVAEKTKISINNLSSSDRDKIKSEFEKLKQNKSKEAVIAFAKTIAPIALKETKKVLQPKITEVFKKSGLSGSGKKSLGIYGKGSENFEDEFVKNMVKKMGY